MTQQKLTGIVTWYDPNPRVGYGFIKADNTGTSFFVHPKCLIGEIPRKGDLVSFVAFPGMQGRSPETRQVEVTERVAFSSGNDARRRAKTVGPITRVGS
jgi:cold shock CspA family protein